MEHNPLGWIQAGACRIGFVDEVNGPGAEEVDFYKPTRHELKMLARYWAKTQLDIQVSWFFYRQAGSTDIRLEPYAANRLRRLSEAIGREVVDALVKELQQDQRKKMGDEFWRVFIGEATEEEKARVNDKIDREIL
jgi:hypothetical protein